MLKQKEFIRIFAVWIIISLMVSLKEPVSAFRFVKILGIFAIIIATFTTCKKLAAYYYETEEEQKIWQWKRYGLREKAYFKESIPIGIILTIISPFLTAGSIIWLATTQSEIKPKKSRAAKRHGFLSFSELTEFHIAVISAAGIISLLILAPIAYLLNFPLLTKWSVYFAIFNIIPLGQLDGTKIFFGSRGLYAILLIFTALSLFYTFLI